MKTKMKMRMLSLLLCFVMLVGLMPTSVFAAGTKLETPQNLKLQGTVLSWNAVDNADFYGVTLYHPNYVYSIGSWQTDGTSINLYKYLKDGETYGATVIACSNGSYQISTPAEIPLTACTNAGVPIYRDVNVVNGTSSNATAYPGMSVRLEAKPAPDGMVFDRWELSGGYINIGYSDTDTLIYVQAICDNDISARATYKYQENVTSAFTVQPQGGAALVDESFNVTYAMNFTPQGAVKVQVEGNTPGDFTDLKQGAIDSASVQEDSVVTKTFRIMASDGTRNIYSDEFVVSWEDGPRFISQPMGGTVDHNVDFVATYALNFTPFSCCVERYNDYLGQWVELSFASATQATISSYDFNTSSNYRIKAIIEGGGEVYSDEFTVTWSDAVSKFIQHPVGGTIGFDEDFSFTFAINFTPVSNVAIQKYNSGFDSWDTVSYCTSLTSGTISGFASETTNKYRLEAYGNGTPIHSNEFTVTWEGTDYTVSFAANGGSGTIADETDQLGGYILPDCSFSAPAGKQFLCWAEDGVAGNRYAVGEEYNVTGDVTFYAIWEDIPVTEYMVAYSPTEGSGTMVGAVVEENGTFTLEDCAYIAPEGKQFKAWAIGSVNGTQKQPGEQITITGETYIYAIWEDIPAGHTCDIKPVAKVEPTCTTGGKNAYYKCDGCGKFFEDALGTSEITDLAAWGNIVALGHSYTTTTTQATLSKDGKVESKCSACGYVKSATTICYPKTIELSATSYTYNSKVNTPAVTVKDSKGNTLKKDTDYTVVYAAGRKNTGKYAVTITFKGNYSGAKTLYFNILPSKTSKITPTNTTTSIKTAWKKVTGASGYKVELLNSKGKVLKTATTTKLTYTFKKLSKVTTYKVRVTAYKTIDSKKVYASVSTTLTTSTAPAKVTLSKVTAGSKQATPAWKTVRGASGYEVQYSTSSKFKSAKTTTVKKGSSKKTTIKKLTRGKKYYFKVRAYKTVSGKKVYGAWSKVESVRIK